ncbi:MAG: hypothetical protein H0W88_01550 [Parachlamydiaceae bacterium]|nr:hypothetical protein [Parachlamydiaceae bacterium]
MVPSYYSLSLTSQSPIYDSSSSESKYNGYPQLELPYEEDINSIQAEKLERIQNTLLTLKPKKEGYPSLSFKVSDFITYAEQEISKIQNEKIEFLPCGSVTDPQNYEYNDIDYRVYIHKPHYQVIRHKLIKFIEELLLSHKEYNKNCSLNPQNLVAVYFDGFKLFVDKSGAFYSLQGISITIFDTSFQHIHSDSAASGIQIIPSRKQMRIAMGNRFASNQDEFKSWISCYYQRNYVIHNPDLIKDLFFRLRCKKTEGWTVDPDTFNKSIEIAQKVYFESKEFRFKFRTHLQNHFPHREGKMIEFLNVLTTFQNDSEWCKKVAAIFIDLSPTLALKDEVNIAKLIATFPETTPILLNFIRGIFFCKAITDGNDRFYYSGRIVENSKRANFQLHLLCDKNDKWKQRKYHLDIPGNVSPFHILRSLQSSMVYLNSFSKRMGKTDLSYLDDLFVLFGLNTHFLTEDGNIHIDKAILHSITPEIDQILRTYYKNEYDLRHLYSRLTIVDHYDSEMLDFKSAIANVENWILTCDKYNEKDLKYYLILIQKYLHCSPSQIDMNELSFLENNPKLLIKNQTLRNSDFSNNLKIACVNLLPRIILNILKEPTRELFVRVDNLIELSTKMISKNLQKQIVRIKLDAFQKLSPEEQIGLQEWLCEYIAKALPQNFLKPQSLIQTLTQLSTSKNPEHFHVAFDYIEDALSYVKGYEKEFLEMFCTLSNNAGLDFTNRIYSTLLTIANLQPELFKELLKKEESFVEFIIAVAKNNNHESLALLTLASEVNDSKEFIESCYNVIELYSKQTEIATEPLEGICKLSLSIIQKKGIIAPELLHTQYPVVDLALKLLKRGENHEFLCVEILNEAIKAYPKRIFVKDIQEKLLLRIASTLVNEDKNELYNRYVKVLKILNDMTKLYEVSHLGDLKNKTVERDLPILALQFQKFVQQANSTLLLDKQFQKLMQFNRKIKAEGVLETKRSIQPLELSWIDALNNECVEFNNCYSKLSASKILQFNQKIITILNEKQSHLKDLSKTQLEFFIRNVTTIISKHLAFSKSGALHNAQILFEKIYATQLMDGAKLESMLSILITAYVETPLLNELQLTKLHYLITLVREIDKSKKIEDQFNILSYYTFISAITRMSHGTNEQIKFSADTFTEYLREFPKDNDRICSLSKNSFFILQECLKRNDGKCFLIGFAFINELYKSKLHNCDHWNTKIDQSLIEYVKAFPNYFKKGNFYSQEVNELLGVLVENKSVLRLSPTDQTSLLKYIQLMNNKLDGHLWNMILQICDGNERTGTLYLRKHLEEFCNSNKTLKVVRSSAEILSNHFNKAMEFLKDEIKFEALYCNTCIEIMSITKDVNYVVQAFEIFKTRKCTTPSNKFVIHFAKIFINLKYNESLDAYFMTLTYWLTDISLDTSAEENKIAAKYFKKIVDYLNSTTQISALTLLGEILIDYINTAGNKVDEAFFINKFISIFNQKHLLEYNSLVLTYQEEATQHLSMTGLASFEKEINNLCTELNEQLITDIKSIQKNSKPENCQIIASTGVQIYNALTLYTLTNPENGRRIIRLFIQKVVPLLDCNNIENIRFLLTVIDSAMIDSSLYSTKRTGICKVIPLSQSEQDAVNQEEITVYQIVINFLQESSYFESIKAVYRYVQKYQAMMGRNPKDVNPIMGNNCSIGTDYMSHAISKADIKVFKEYIDPLNNLLRTHPDHLYLTKIFLPTIKELCLRACLFPHILKEISTLKEISKETAKPSLNVCRALIDNSSEDFNNSIKQALVGNKAIHSILSKGFDLEKFIEDVGGSIVLYDFQEQFDRALDKASIPVMHRIAVHFFELYCSHSQKLGTSLNNVEYDKQELIHKKFLFNSLSESFKNIQDSDMSKKFTIINDFLSKEYLTQKSNKENIVTKDVSKDQEKAKIESKTRFEFKDEFKVSKKAVSPPPGKCESKSEFLRKKRLDSKHDSKSKNHFGKITLNIRADE